MEPKGISAILHFSFDRMASDLATNLVSKGAFVQLRADARSEGKGKPSPLHLLKRS